MKKILFIVSILFSFNCVAQFTLNDFKALHGLSGTWKMQKKKGFVVEKWNIINDSTLSGYGYMRTATDSFPQEQIMLTLRKGIISYNPVVASQNDGNPVAFTLTAIDKEKFIFENKAHDFPTMISYQFVDRNTLNAAISGMMSNEKREILYNYIREQ